VTRAAPPVAGPDVELDVEVIFDEGGVLVVDKPAGLAMHGGVGVANEESLHGAIKGAGDIEPGFDGPSFLGRLDRPTSGLVVACLEKAALVALEPHWRSGAVVKEYLVVVHGLVEKEGVIDVPLAARSKRLKGSGRVEEARTSYRRIDGNARASLVAARLHPGRTHQIRRHMKAVGHPVVGDTRYGKRGDEGEAGLMLHAWRLTHDGSVPIVPRVLEAPVPERIRAACAALGLSVA
jgi:23S rRNA-/tRNA-specific pseudouridylate synthase